MSVPWVRVDIDINTYQAPEGFALLTLGRPPIFLLLRCLKCESLVASSQDEISAGIHLRELHGGP